MKSSPIGRLNRGFGNTGAQPSYFRGYLLSCYFGNTSWDALMTRCFVGIDDITPSSEICQSGIVGNLLDSKLGRVSFSLVKTDLTA